MAFVFTYICYNLPLIMLTEYRKTISLICLCNKWTSKIQWMSTSSHN